MAVITKQNTKIINNENNRRNVIIYYNDNNNNNNQRINRLGNNFTQRTLLNLCCLEIEITEKRIFYLKQLIVLSFFFLFEILFNNLNFYKFVLTCEYFIIFNIVDHDIHLIITIIVYCIQYMLLDYFKF